MDEDEEQLPGVDWAQYETEQQDEEAPRFQLYIGLTLFGRFIYLQLG